MEAAQQQGATGTCLLELPNHLLLHILSLTDAHTLCAAARSCVALFRLASLPELWPHFRQSGPLQAALRQCLSKALHLPPPVFHLLFEPGRSRKFPITVTLYNLRGILGVAYVEDLALQLSHAMQERVDRLPPHSTYARFEQPLPQAGAAAAHPPAAGAAAAAGTSSPQQRGAPGSSSGPSQHVPGPAQRPVLLLPSPLATLAVCRADRGTVRVGLRPSAAVPAVLRHIWSLPWPPGWKGLLAGTAPQETGPTAPGAAPLGQGPGLGSSGWDSRPGSQAWGGGSGEAPAAAATAAVVDGASAGSYREGEVPAAGQGLGASTGRGPTSNGGGMQEGQWKALQESWIQGCAARLASLTPDLVLPQPGPEASGRASPRSTARAAAPAGPLSVTNSSHVAAGGAEGGPGGSSTGGGGAGDAAGTAHARASSHADSAPSASTHPRSRRKQAEDGAPSPALITGAVRMLDALGASREEVAALTPQAVKLALLTSGSVSITDQVQGALPSSVRALWAWHSLRKLCAEVSSRCAIRAGGATPAGQGLRPSQEALYHQPQQPGAISGHPATGAGAGDTARSESCSFWSQPLSGKALYAVSQAAGEEEVVMACALDAFPAALLELQPASASHSAGSLTGGALVTPAAASTAAWDLLHGARTPSSLPVMPAAPLPAGQPLPRTAELQASLFKIAAAARDYMHAPRSTSALGLLGGVASAQEESVERLAACMAQLQLRGSAGTQAGCVGPGDGPGPRTQQLQPQSSGFAGQVGGGVAGGAGLPELDGSLNHHDVLRLCVLGACLRVAAWHAWLLGME